MIVNDGRLQKIKMSSIKIEEFLWKASEWDRKSDMKNKGKLSIYKHVKLNNTEKNYLTCSKFEFGLLVLI